MVAGGLSALKEKDDDVCTLVANTRQLPSWLIDDVNTNEIVSRIVAYKTQVVAGVNYFVKIRMKERTHGSDSKDQDGSEELKETDVECVHVRIFKPLPHTQKMPRLVGVRVKCSLNDPIEYFESNVDE